MPDFGVPAGSGSVDRKSTSRFGLFDAVHSGGFVASGNGAAAGAAAGQPSGSMTESMVGSFASRFGTGHGRNGSLPPPGSCNTMDGSGPPPESLVGSSGR